MTLSNSEIIELLEKMDKDVKSLKEELLRMCWFMRGGLTYEEASYLSSDERGIIKKIIDNNMEIAKKNSIPFF